MANDHVHKQGFVPVDVQLPYLILPNETAPGLFYGHIALSIRLENQS